jgi:hypothetical protein
VKRCALLFAALLGSAPVSSGEPMEGPNGHYYELVIASRTGWEDARLASEATVFQGIQGHLATITSREEDLFINAFCSGGAQELWVGGFQASHQSNPGQGWMWVNDEGPIRGYLNWEEPEPNDFPGPEDNSENYLAVFHCPRFGWNDEGNVENIAGYVIEYDVPETLFRRGETNNDSSFNIGDAVNILFHLFSGTGDISCRDAADTNDDGNLTIVDAVRILGFLFLDAAPPLEPFGACGADPTKDPLDCQAFACD